MDPSSSNEETKPNVPTSFTFSLPTARMSTPAATLSNPFVKNNVPTHAPHSGTTASPFAPVETIGKGAIRPSLKPSLTSAWPSTRCPPIFEARNFPASVKATSISVSSALATNSPKTLELVNPEKDAVKVPGFTTSKDEVPSSSPLKQELLQEAPANPHQLKRIPSVDKTQLRTIVVYLIPEDSNNKLELAKHFQPFGNIVRIFPNPKKGNAVIHFDSHEAADKAKRLGTKLRPNVDLKILFKQIATKGNKMPLVNVPSEGGKESHNRPVSTDMTKLSKKPTTFFNLSDGIPMAISMDELKSILAQPAHSVGDRATLLDARDRLVRLSKESKAKATSSIKEATLLKGTCLDMCPEKERYSRAEKRRLASYELLASQDYEVDHRHAVKEYSRSSADQAEPLAHELRPLSVLQMTMDYLVAKIVDRCDKPGENLSEWFNFLWDRTRGVRKDLTQQSLCEPGSVDLVEKCARFHIHCTARLCELDMQDFDQKINDENLTKCMQTLKHMYYDLEVKSIYCPNEGEFRAYDVLLHPNDGEVLREVLQLRPEIRNSRKVRDALKFVNALNSRNYVLFFKLAKRNGDYLQCCLLQRYFNQIRNQALQIMVQSYGPPKKGQVQLVSLVNLLGFEDRDEAALWCDLHGLLVDASKETVYLERSSFIDLPEKFPPLRRSFQLIESKRTSPVSAIIANGPVPPDPTGSHQPHNSFDEKGVLLKEAWFAEDQCDEAQLLPVMTFSGATSTSSTVSVSLPVLESICGTVAEEVISSTVKETVFELAKQIDRQRKIATMAYIVTKNFFDQFSRDFCKELASEAIAEELAEKCRLEKQKQNEERKRRAFAIQFLGEIIDDFVSNEVYAISGTQLQEALFIRAKNAKDKIAKELLESLMTSLVFTEAQKTANTVASEAIHAREKLVARVRDLVSQRRLRRWISIWKQYTIKQIRRRLERQTFPACPSRMNFGQQAASLRSRGETSSTLALKRKSIVDQNMSAKRLNSLSDLQSCINLLSSTLESNVVNICALLEEPLRRRLEKRYCCFWKLVIIAIDCVGVGDLFLKWLGLERHVVQSETGWTYIETISSDRPLTICIQFVENGEHIRVSLQGANALLTVYKPDVALEGSLQRLAQLVTTHLEYNPLSVATIATNPLPPNCSHLATILQPRYHLVLDMEAYASDKQLKLAKFILDLAEDEQLDVGQSKHLRISSLWELANDFISHKILPTIYRDLQERLQHDFNHQPFDLLLDFYNRGIRYLKEKIVSDPNLSHVKWPAQELLRTPQLGLPPMNWNASIYQHQLGHLLESYLVLPEWQNKPSDFSSTCSALRDYSLNLSMFGIDAIPLISRIEALLCNSNASAGSYHNVPHIGNIPWTDIFQACIDSRIQAFEQKGSATIVGYFAREIDNFQAEESWMKTCSLLSSLSEGMSKKSSEQPRIDNESGDKSMQIQVGHQNLSYAGTLEVPVPIAELFDQIKESSILSRMEDQRFEFMLENVLTTPSLPRRRTPSSTSERSLHFTADNLEERADLLERSLRESRREDTQFESYLKRALQKDQT